MKFNDFQQLAIDTVDKDILVSAGAGSGKTGTMIERISSNIIQKKVTVDNLLVVTFTNAAASEMRKKLETRLKQIVQDSSTSEADRIYLKSQIDLLGQSDISTLHKFCQTIIKKYFYVVGLDPNFALGDDSQTAVLKSEAIESLFRELAQKDKQFDLLASIFDDKRNYNKIKTYVFKIHNFLTNQPDVAAFKSLINDVYSVDSLDENILMKTLNEYVGEMFEYFTEQFQVLKNEALGLKLFSIVDLLGEYVTSLFKVNRKNTFTQNHHFVFNQPKLTLLRKSKKDDDVLSYMKDKVKLVRDDFATNLEKVQKNLFLSNDLAKLKQDLLDTKEIMLAMFSLVEKFEDAYIDLKLQKKLLDFSDLEHFAYKILCNKEVAEQVKGGYSQIYVDEYQDVNDIQEGIINIVHREKDLFLVGDVKQSIYGFRNTNPQIFLNKLGIFSKLVDNKVAIVFSENYRTDQRILNLVNFVFSCLMTTSLGGINYNPEHMMHNHVNHTDGPNYFPQIEFDIVKNEKSETDEEETKLNVYKVSTAPFAETKMKQLAHTEGVIIAQKIMALMTEQKTFFDAKSQTPRKIEYSDITLLCRGRTDSVMEITKTLASYGIPVAQISKGDIFSEYEIQLLVSYLKLVFNPHDDVNLLNLLAAPFISLDENELSHVRVYVRDNNSESNVVEFYTCAKIYCEKNDDAISKKLKKAFDLIEDGRTNMENGTIFATLNNFCSKTHYLTYLCALPDGKTRVNNALGFINSFVDKAYNTDLVEFILNLEKIVDSFAIEPELDVGVNCVKVETMHHSKGLEYPIVFLVDMGHGFNTEEQNGDFLLNSNLGVGLFKYDPVNRIKVPTLSLGAVKVAMTNKAYAENVRLLYVAMTRAKNNLFITGSVDLKKVQACLAPFALKNKKNFLELLLSCCDENSIADLQAGGREILVDIGSKNKLKINVFDKISEEKTDNIISFNPKELGNVNAKFNDYVSKNEHYVYKFNDYVSIFNTTSVTKLNQANKCVEDFEDDGYLSITEEKSINRGLAYHKVMQFVDFENSDENSINDLIQDVLDEDSQKLVDREKIISAVTNLKDIVKNAKLLREQPFLMKEKHKNLVKNGVDEKVMVHGVIDLVVIKNNEIILLDYKTSDTLNVEKTAKSYVTQLDCYAKAIEKTLGLPVTKKFLYFFLQERLILVDI